MAAFSDHKVWVHCVVNYRVSAFLYHYQLIVQSATEEQARKVILPSWQPNEVWQQFMAIPREEVALQQFI